MKQTNGRDSVDPVDAALESARARLADVPAMLRDMTLSAWSAFARRWPRGDAAAIAERIEWGTTKVLELYANECRRILGPVDAEIAAVRIANADESRVLLPRDAVAARVRDLQFNGWGLTGKVADLDFLILAMHERETIVSITPASITLRADDGSERTVDHITLAQNNRPLSHRIYLWERDVIEPLKRVIEAAERRLAARDRQPSSGIITDKRP